MTRVLRTASKDFASSNITSIVISNGPAFLLLQALARARSLAMSDALVFDGEHAQRIVGLDDVPQRELVHRAALDVRWRERERHVAFLAQPPGKIGVEQGDSSDGSDGVRDFLA